MAETETDYAKTPIAQYVADLINPTGVIPVGPEQDFTVAHHRDGAL